MVCKNKKGSKTTISGAIVTSLYIKSVIIAVAVEWSFPPISNSTSMFMIL